MKKPRTKPAAPPAADASAAGRSRRAFLKLAAAGSAAALAMPALALAADAKRASAAKPAKPASGRAPEIEKGIAEQKGYLKQTVEAIRAFELPPGAEQAFTFAVMPAARKGRRP